MHKLNRKQRRQQAAKATAGARANRPTSASRPSTPAQSASRDLRADKLDDLRQRDGFTPLREGLRKIAHDRGEWAGIPMPMQDLDLIVEPRYAYASALTKTPSDDERDLAGVTMRNRFYSSRWRCDIYVWSEGGRVLSGKVPRVHGMGFMLHTLGATLAWGIEQEHNALKLLGSLIPHHAFKQYLLCGMFMETSKRSGLTYVFRKLRPTVVIDIRPNQITYDFGDLSARRHGVEKSRILCCLCMHPIAYYDQSWAGAMTPTDDVVAHLMLMRGDEPMFWRRCNQHNPAMPEAGL